MKENIMKQHEFYRQIAEQTGEDYQTIERLGFTPIVPRYRYYAKRRFRKRRKKQSETAKPIQVLDV